MGVGSVLYVWAETDRSVRPIGNIGLDPDPIEDILIIDGIDYSSARGNY